MYAHLMQVVVAAFPILVVVAAVNDFLWMRISNALSAALFVAGLAALALAAPGWEAFGAHLGTAALVLVVGFAIFATGQMAGGDVKFATAVALWLGWGDMFEYVLLFSLWGGGLTLLTLAADHWLSPIPALKVGYLGGFGGHRTVPYGIAMTAAALQIFPHTAWFAVFLAG